MTKNEKKENARRQSDILSNTILTQLRIIWAELNPTKIDSYNEPDTWQYKCDRVKFIRTHPIYESFCALSESIDNL